MWLNVHLDVRRVQQDGGGRWPGGRQGFNGCKTARGANNISLLSSFFVVLLFLLFPSLIRSQFMLLSHFAFTCQFGTGVWHITAAYWLPANAVCVNLLLII